MIIEDDRAIAVSLQKALEYSGYSVTHAVHGQDAMAKLEAESDLPDLMIVDIMMPVMDGLEFRKKQLQHEKFKNIPVIFLTASDVDRDELMKLRPYESLVKPIDLNDLLTILHNFFFIP